MDFTGLPVIDFNNRAQLPHVSAVYFVIQEDRLLYIGRALDLRRRWLNQWHDKYVMFKDLPALRIAWFETVEVVTLERKLIPLLRPPYNKSVPNNRLPKYPPKQFGVDWLHCICKRCGHEWVSRKGVPVVCPSKHCHSPFLGSESSVTFLNPHHDGY